MYFEFTESQKAIQKAAREFAEKEFKPEYGRKCDQEYKWPEDLHKKAAQLGFIGVHFPEKYCGQGLGILESCIVIEEFSRVDSTLANITWAIEGADIIVNFGNEEQKQKYIPRICKGEAISTLALTEPAHGSDVGVTGLNTVAKKDGDYWVINGAKTFISMGSIADYLVTGCLTNPDAKPPYRGVSAIIVEKGTFGLEVRDLHPKMGQRSIPSTELSFSDVRVPLSNLVGEENRGFYYIMDYIIVERLHAAAYCIGVAQGALERVLKYSTQRTQFGEPIARFQITQYKIADMTARLEAARLLVYKAAWLYDSRKGEGGLIRRSASMAKNLAVETAKYVIDEAIQIYGGYGYVDSDLERFYRDVRVYDIAGGTKEMCILTIAGELYRDIGFRI
ncbi:MAG: acyl-CoA dehydrogenase family protein [Candidatus Bathyarchaeia archaeon]